MESPINPESQIVASLAVAALVGLAVGIEREWSGHASGPEARFAGARTFLLLGLTGGLAGVLGESGLAPIATALLAGAALLSVTAYVVAASRGSPEAVDGTTEAAAITVLGLGALAGLGELRLAAGAGAVIVLALREKSAIHGFVERLGEVEFRAGLQFAVLALVLLPILPEGPYGPLGGIRPRELWILVLIVSALNFLGDLARRLVGVTRGTVVAGMLGGLVSSTAVALSFARRSREQGDHGDELALGVVGACTVLLPRLCLLTLVLRPALTVAVLPYFLPPLLVGAGLVAAGLRRGAGENASPATDAPSRSPLRLGSALLLALGFQAVLMIMSFVRDRFGDVGVLTSAALLGLTDMDALTLSMSRLASEDGIRLAATALAVGVLANTLLKLSAVLALGAGDFRRRAGLGLVALATASIVGILLGR